MLKQLDLSFKTLAIPLTLLVAFSTLGFVFWRSSGYIEPLILFGYIGLALGIGLGLYAALPKKQKPLGRKISLLMIGSFLILFVGIMGSENIQFEGLIFGLTTGVFQAAVMHYLIAKVFGPLLFGRLWCGWACWTVMLLDFLPFTRSQGRLPGKWGWLRYLHITISAGLVLMLVTLGYTGGITGRSGILWFLIGNLAYYAIGVALAVALKDNRAFCKYICPVSIVFKPTARFSVLKIDTLAENCNDCMACEQLCPMDIEITHYLHNNQRVGSTECSLCQTCVSICSKDALKLSFGLDMGKKEYLKIRE